MRAEPFPPQNIDVIRHHTAAKTPIRWDPELKNPNHGQVNSLHSQILLQPVVLAQRGR